MHIPLSIRKSLGKTLGLVVVALALVSCGGGGSSSVSSEPPTSTKDEPTQNSSIGYALSVTSIATTETSSAQYEGNFATQPTPLTTNSGHYTLQLDQVGLASTSP